MSCYYHMGGGGLLSHNGVHGAVYRVGGVEEEDS